jgi:hypothetical protein
MEAGNVSSQDLKREFKRALSPRDVSEQLGVAVGTLANLRSQGRGPRYFRMPNGGGKKAKIFYRPEDVESWAFSEPIMTLDAVNGRG